MGRKTNLLGLTRSEVDIFFKSIEEKSFRTNQLMKWIYHFGISDFDEMTNMSKALRSKLKKVSEIRAPQLIEEKVSFDGTRKWIVQVDSGDHIETVYIPQGKRGTLCVSSQAGCALNCSFCSTGRQGFNSNLTSAEIIGQIWIAEKYLRVSSYNIGKVTNVVMMGMGEPLLNFNNVISSMCLMMDDLGYGISKRRVTLSTSGVIPMIYRLVREKIDVSLALSLHAPNDELRSKLVPINKKYPIKDLLVACQKYVSTLGEKRLLTIEYTLIKDINDSEEHALQTIQLLKEVPCKINLIPFNPFLDSGYECPSNNTVHKFQKLLRNAGYNVTVRTTRGEDISAACGQLVGAINDRTRRNQRDIFPEKIELVSLPLN